MLRDIERDGRFDGRPPIFRRGESIDVVKRKRLPDWRYHERHGGGTIEGNADTGDGKNRYYTVRCRCGESYDIRADNLVRKPGPVGRQRPITD